MKKYFYSDGSNNFGPFTIEELKEKGITRETSVWFHELGEWKKAGTVPELNDLFTFTPPPLPNFTNYSQTPNRQSSLDKTIDLFVFLSIVYWFSTNLINFIIEKVVDDWWSNDIITYFRIGTNIIFAAIPIVFALSLKGKTLKIIALILAALLSIYFLYSNIEWLIRELK